MKLGPSAVVFFVQGKSRMRSIRSAVSLLLPAALAVLGGGCAAARECEPTAGDSCAETLTDEPYVPPACVPAWNVSPVSESCGVFVSKSSGDDTNAGNPSAPVATLARALALAAGRPIYACAEDFHGALVLPPGSAFFGGLDCTAGFRWTGGVEKTRIWGEPGQVPLVLERGEGVSRIEDLAVFAADATTSGGSSIAVFADHARATLTRCDFRAGHGAEGAPGESAPADPERDGRDGLAGAPSCTDKPTLATPGGASVEMKCADGMVTAGGKGGDGGALLVSGEILPGQDGYAGSPGGASGGEGESSVFWGCDAGMGSSGKNGGKGAPGAGASGEGYIGAAGYVGIAGGIGGHGTPGGGGGGAGGARGGKQICAGGSGAGASGGSGGTGGCGGKGGGGGGPGGASVGLVSIESSLVVADSRVVAGEGGQGGRGGNGQPGGSGGVGGAGGKGGTGSDACHGGAGGKGGSGGAGGGGLGGPSIVIAHLGEKPTLRGAVSLGEGSPGQGGSGGDGGLVGNHGASGYTAAIRAF
jgi:hypothetical protein